MTDPLTEHRTQLTGLRREMDKRLDSLMTDKPVDPASLPDLLASVRSLAARIELDIREAHAAPELMRAA